MSLIYWPQVVGPLASGSTLTHDPFFSSVVQLAHFEGTNGSHTLTNSCPRGNTLQTSTSTISTANFKFGLASMNNPTGTLKGAIAPSTADYNFGTSDWTIEFFLNPDTLTLQNNSVKIYYDSRNSSLTNQWVPTIASTVNNGNLVYSANGSVRITAGAGTIAATIWQHVAVSRVSGTTRMFVNGNQVGSDFVDSNTYVQCQICIGLAGNNGGSTSGYWDELRVTNGVGRYSTNFTPPVAAFPNQ